MLTIGDAIDVTIEKPASGGRMIARHDGRVVLVAGSIPGERVRARLERVDRKVAFATVAEVLEPSTDRREVAADPGCGGCVYAHIDYARQLTIKAAVVADAFARLAKLPLEQGVEVAGSPEHGYRMRARLHVRGERSGFYREGTHDLCDAGPTGQLRSESLAAASAAVAALVAAGHAPTGIEIAENIQGDQRILHASLAGEAAAAFETLRSVLNTEISGISTRAETGPRTQAGAESVAESVAVLTGGQGSGELRHRAESFFQANRFLLPALVRAVLDAANIEGDVLDLYAGVGLFSVALASMGRTGITAVEGDRTSGSDLRQNAGPFAEAIRTVLTPVESHVSRASSLPPTVIVDPPRTGMSPEVIDALVGKRARRLIYVSCDPPTMARDARRLVDGGFDLRSLAAFDLFPNTAHVETLGVFER